jgi:ferric enterobactin receptor
VLHSSIFAFPLNHFMKKLLLLFSIAFIFSNVHGQMPMMGGGGGSDTKIYDGKVSGIVFDNASAKPIELANIALYKTGSDKPVDGTVTDEKGAFKLKNIKPGKYKVSVSFLGYLAKDYDSLEITDKKYNIELGRIQLNQNAKLLSEATVETEKSLVETQIDKIVYNADKDISIKGGNGTDVLRKVPMVSVDLDGNVMLQGTSNIKVLINNKPSSIMAASVGDALKMIPADEIEKVEVITSPSAKYDAEGTGGIINIITKKKTMEGVSGSIYAGAGTRSSNLFSNLTWRKSRFGTGLSLGGFMYQGKGDLTTTRTTDYSILTQNGTNKNKGAGPYIQWTTDFDINSKNNISSSLRVNDFSFKSDGLTNNHTVFYNSSSTLNDFTSDFKTETTGNNYDASLDYKRTFTKPDQEWTASAQLTNSDRDIDYNVTRNYSSDIWQVESSLNKSSNREMTFQSDYTHPFSKKFTLEVGAKSIIRNVKSDYDYDYEFSPNLPVLPGSTNSDNLFLYDQNVYAGYAQGALTLSKWGFKAGTRYEKTDVHGDFDQNSTTFNSDYDNLIPSATVSYRKPGKYSYKLSYTQRIQRPSMNYLNPYVNNSDPNNISYGNPNLTAEKSHAFELGYSLFKSYGSFTFTGFHRFTENAIESVKFIDTTIYHRYVSTYGNIGKNYSTGLSLSTNIMYKMKLFMGANFNLFYYQVKSTDSLNLYNDGINYSVNGYGMYKFSTKWSFSAFANFNGPKYSVQGFSTSFFYYNLSLRYVLKDDKGGIGLGLDNFATPYWNSRNEYEGSDFKFMSNNKIRFFGVRASFDYRFGKMDFKQPKKKGIKNDDLKPGEDSNDMGGGMGGK